MISYRLEKVILKMNSIYNFSFQFHELKNDAKFVFTL